MKVYRIANRLEIDKCYQIMRHAYYGQVDKAGKEYMAHPLIVAHNVYLYFSKYLDEDEYTISICCVYLHDLIKNVYY